MDLGPESLPYLNHWDQRLDTIKQFNKLKMTDNAFNYCSKKKNTKNFFYRLTTHNFFDIFAIQTIQEHWFQPKRVGNVTLNTYFKHLS